MTADELRSAMYGANLRSGSLGSAIGASAAQVRDWTSGRRPIPEKYVPKITAAISQAGAVKRVPSAKAGIAEIAKTKGFAPRTSDARPKTIPTKPSPARLGGVQRKPRRQRRTKPLPVIDPATIDAKKTVRVAADASLADTLSDLANGAAAILLPALFGKPSLLEKGASTVADRPAMQPLTRPISTKSSVAMSPPKSQFAPMPASGILPPEVAADRCCRVVTRMLDGLPRTAFCTLPAGSACDLCRAAAAAAVFR